MLVKFVQKGNTLQSVLRYSRVVRRAKTGPKGDFNESYALASVELERTPFVETRGQKREKAGQRSGGRGRKNGDRDEQPCFSFLMGEQCRFGEECRFIHACVACEDKPKHNYEACPKQDKLAKWKRLADNRPVRN